MKKLILSMMLLAIVGVATAQNYSEKSYREAKRAERNAAYAQKLKAAVVGQSFTINVDYMQADMYGSVPIFAPDNYMTIYPSFLEIDLPYRSYFSVVETPKILNITSDQYTYVAKETNNAFIVTFTITNVINGASMSAFQSTSYAVHINISKTSGSATITITPNMSSAVTYTGTLMIN